MPDAPGVALTPDERRRIVDALGREPTETELYAFDAQWSEHCSYKSSRRHLRKLPIDGPTVMQGPAEDAGILHLGEWNGDRYGVVIAHESHNHPSQVVPFEGAATGVGGIVRDVLCMGAEVIALADALRFGRLDEPHCRYVANSVVDGIAAYANAIGVPTIAGDVYVDESFDDNVLVNVVALGLVKQPDIIHSAAPPGSAGYDIVLVGKATDRSGFGGASFSSLNLDGADAEANKGAVQVPDPFLKNVIMRASYRAFEELRAAGVVAGFKDLGAGGFVGCSAELVAAGGMGAEVDLDAIPVTEPDLPPAVIATGETQERLCWIVPPSFTPRLLAIYNDEYWLPRIAQGARASVVGTVTAAQRYVARRRGAVVMDVPVPFLTGGVQYERPYAAATRDDGAPPEPHRAVERGGFGDVLVRVLAHRDVCSREAIFRRFDGVVRGTTAIPRGYADAGIVVPIDGAPFGVALAVDGNPRYGKLDARGAAARAVVEAACNVAAAGARPLGMTDCLNFGDPTDERQLGDMVAAIDGLSEAARALGTPFVSGNVSLYNQSKSGRAVAPSPIVACVGGVADIAAVATPALKRAGSALFLVGDVQPAFGGSVYAEIAAFESTALVVPDFGCVRRCIDALLAAYAGGLVLAAHDISDGGLLTALAEMVFPALAVGPAGVRLRPVRDWSQASDETTALFAEYGGFVVQAADAARFAHVCAAHGAPSAIIGTTTADGDIVLEGAGGAEDERIDAVRLRAAWSAPLRDFYGAAV